MTNKIGDTKRRPGTRLTATGIVILVIGFALLLMNVTNPVTNYVTGVGMVTTQSPSVGSIVLLLAGLLLAGIGFARRVLAAVEKR